MISKTMTVPHPHNSIHQSSSSKSSMDTVNCYCDDVNNNGDELEQPLWQLLLPDARRSRHCQRREGGIGAAGAVASFAVWNRRCHLGWNSILVLVLSLVSILSSTTCAEPMIESLPSSSTSASGSSNRALFGSNKNDVDTLVLNELLPVVDTQQQSQPMRYESFGNDHIVIDKNGVDSNERFLQDNSSSSSPCAMKGIEYCNNPNKVTTEVGCDPNTCQWIMVPYYTNQTPPRFCNVIDLNQFRFQISMGTLPDSLEPCLLYEQHIDPSNWDNVTSSTSTDTTNNGISSTVDTEMNASSTSTTDDAFGIPVPFDDIVMNYYLDTPIPIVFDIPVLVRVTTQHLLTNLRTQLKGDADLLLDVYNISINGPITTYTGWASYNNTIVQTYTIGGGVLFDPAYGSPRTTVVDRLIKRAFTRKDAIANYVLLLQICKDAAIRRTFNIYDGPTVDITQTASPTSPFDDFDNSVQNASSNAANSTNSNQPLIEWGDWSSPVMIAIMAGAGTALLSLVLVICLICYHTRKNRRLRKQILSKQLPTPRTMMDGDEEMPSSPDHYYNHNNYDDDDDIDETDSMRVVPGNRGSKKVTLVVPSTPPNGNNSPTKSPKTTSSTPLSASATRNTRSFRQQQKLQQQQLQEQSKNPTTKEAAVVTASSSTSPATNSTKQQAKFGTASVRVKNSTAKSFSSQPPSSSAKSSPGTVQASPSTSTKSAAAAVPVIVAVKQSTAEQEVPSTVKTSASVLENKTMKTDNNQRNYKIIAIPMSRVNQSHPSPAVVDYDLQVDHPHTVQVDFMSGTGGSVLYDIEENSNSGVSDNVPGKYNSHGYAGSDTSSVYSYLDNNTLHSMIQDAEYSVNEAYNPNIPGYDDDYDDDDIRNDGTWSVNDGQGSLLSGRGRYYTNQVKDNCDGVIYPSPAVFELESKNTKSILNGLNNTDDNSSDNGTDNSKNDNDTISTFGNDTVEKNHKATFNGDGNNTNEVDTPAKESLNSSPKAGNSRHSRQNDTSSHARKSKSAPIVVMPEQMIVTTKTRHRECDGTNSQTTAEGGQTLIFTDDAYDDESLVSGLALPTIINFGEMHYDNDDDEDVTIDTKTTAEDDKQASRSIGTASLTSSKKSSSKQPNQTKQQNTIVVPPPTSSASLTHRMSPAASNSSPRQEAKDSATLLEKPEQGVVAPNVSSGLPPRSSNDSITSADSKKCKEENCRSSEGKNTSEDSLADSSVTKGTGKDLKNTPQAEPAVSPTASVTGSSSDGANDLLEHESSGSQESNTKVLPAPQSSSEPPATDFEKQTTTNESTVIHMYDFDEDKNDNMSFPSTSGNNSVASSSVQTGDNTTGTGDEPTEIIRATVAERRIAASALAYGSSARVSRNTFARAGRNSQVLGAVDESSTSAVAVSSSTAEDSNDRRNQQDEYELEDSDDENMRKYESVRRYLQSTPVARYRNNVTSNSNKTRVGGVDQFDAYNVGSPAGEYGACNSLMNRNTFDLGDASESDIQSVDDDQRSVFSMNSRSVMESPMNHSNFSSPKDEFRFGPLQRGGAMLTDEERKHLGIKSPSNRTSDDDEDADDDDGIVLPNAYNKRMNSYADRSYDNGYDHTTQAPYMSMLIETNKRSNAGGETTDDDDLSSTAGSDAGMKRSNYPVDSMASF